MLPAITFPAGSRHLYFEIHQLTLDHNFFFFFFFFFYVFAWLGVLLVSQVAGRAGNDGAARVAH